MNETVDFLLRHGYALLFFSVLAEQLGLPLPATPLLLAAGALAGTGKMNPVLAWSLAVAASLAGDFLWFHLGRTRGSSVLRLLCGISLEPDTCVRTTKASWSRHGSKWLLFAKFVPGLSTVAPPMAGMLKVSPAEFLLMDTVGAGLWAGTFVIAGWSFRNQLEVIASYLSRFGAWLGIAVVSGLLVYVAVRHLRRQRVLHSLRIARITPLELRERMNKGDNFTIVDLRNAFEWREARIPGALTLSDEQLTTFLAASGGEFVLYCSCPHESSTISAAMRLARNGIDRIRPLEGGFPLWLELGLPVEMK
jgi:membrane protein DedA with SNARE-associated domain/rhodanese-related sulfurtransferase